jgi:hypothetical protein
MKKYALLAVAFVLTFSFQTFAQNNDKKPNTEINGAQGFQKANPQKLVKQNG